MRKLIYLVAAIGLAACSVPVDAPLPPQGGAIVERSDPRDRDQCRAQPDLAWCANARAAGDIPGGKR